MATPLNDQWVLDRTQLVGHPRPPHAPDDESQESDALEARDHEHDWPRPHIPRVRGRRVPWIDRDT
jgi:hypothetical protein